MTGYLSVYRYILDVGLLDWLPPGADHIPCLCPGLEVSAGSCFGLPPRSLLSHPGNQRSQFTPLNGAGVTLCSFCSYLPNPGPCILGGWPLCVEWASFGKRLLPIILSDTFYSSLKTVLFCRARVGNATE